MLIISIKTDRLRDCRYRINFRINFCRRRESNPGPARSIVVSIDESSIKLGVWEGWPSSSGRLLSLPHGRSARGRFRLIVSALAALYWLEPSMQHRPERLGHSSSLTSPVRKHFKLSTVHTTTFYTAFTASSESSLSKLTEPGKYFASVKRQKLEIILILH